MPSLRRSRYVVHAVAGFGCSLFVLACSDAEAQPAPVDEEPSAGQWYQLAQGLSGALFSVSGTSATDVWVVGSNRGRGRGPFLLHWDGKRWQSTDTGLEADDLLWVSAVGDDVFTVGSRGTVLRKRGSGFEQQDVPTGQDLWGVWGASADDVWAVGGTPSGGSGVVLRYDGDAWRSVDWTADAEGLPTPSAWYKVWGRASDDVYFCGTDGALMHWDGEGFTALDAGTDRTLLTVHGRRDGSLVTAVGGQFTATLVASSDGASFADVTPEPRPQGLLGVFHARDVAYAVGLDSFVLRQEGGGPWIIEETGLYLYQGLHGVWIDPEGGVWSAGGQVQATPYDLGQLVYRGEHPPDPFED